MEALEVSRFALTVVVRAQLSVPFKSFLGVGSRPCRLLNDGRVVILFDPLFLSAWSDIIDLARTRSRSHTSRSAGVVVFGKFQLSFLPIEFSLFQVIFGLLF